MSKKLLVSISEIQTIIDIVKKSKMERYNKRMLIDHLSVLSRYSPLTLRKFSVPVDIEIDDQVFVWLVLNGLKFED